MESPSLDAIYKEVGMEILLTVTLFIWALMAAVYLKCIKDANYDDSKLSVLGLMSLVISFVMMVASIVMSFLL
jgi:hypothetical protein